MIQYLIMDVDGSITDGKIYMGANGEVMKAFSIKDGYVINYILKPHNIEPVVITARTSSIVQCRCEELHISKVYQGKLDKLKTLRCLRLFLTEKRITPLSKLSRERNISA